MVLFQPLKPILSVFLLPLVAFRGKLYPHRLVHSLVFSFASMALLFLLDVHSFKSWKRKITGGMDKTSHSSRRRPIYWEYWYQFQFSMSSCIEMNALGNSNSPTILHITWFLLRMNIDLPRFYSDPKTPAISHLQIFAFFSTFGFQWNIITMPTELYFHISCSL